MTNEFSGIRDITLEYCSNRCAMFVNVSWGAGSRLSLNNLHEVHVNAQQPTCAFRQDRLRESQKSTTEVLLLYPDTN